MKLMEDFVYDYYPTSQQHDIFLFRYIKYKQVLYVRIMYALSDISWD